ncbi:MAG: ExbD/TolR family protein [Nitrospinales bacterium]
MLRFKSEKREQFQLDLIPMINVIFLLLIFFMLTAHALNQDVEVTLPEAKSSEKNIGRNVTVSVTPQGDVEIDGRAVNIDSLLPLLEEKLKKTDKKIVVIRADENAEFDLFGKIIDIATQAGAEDFMLATELPEEVGSGQPG